MKRPSFQFYPADWLRDTALRSCSIGARGLWIDMICFMHEGNPYGVLKVGNKVILPANLAVMVGATLKEIEGWLDELESAQVFDRGEEGEVMSRRMIKDENLRNIRAEGGKKGGNPSLMVNREVGVKVNLKDNQKPTPSSSSSSSSSASTNKRMAKPSVEEILEYGQTLDPPFRKAEAFIAFYESNGWKVGKNPMKAWQAAVRTWQQKDKTTTITKPRPTIESMPYHNTGNGHRPLFD